MSPVIGIYQVSLAKNRFHRALLQKSRVTHRIESCHMQSCHTWNSVMSHGGISHVITHVVPLTEEVKLKYLDLQI